MKGMIFSELINWVEAEYSPDCADAMIRRSSVSNDGAYTSVGYYPFIEALELLIALSSITDQPVADLARSYGQFLAQKLAEGHPNFITEYSSVYTFLSAVESKVHMEVRKLYPDAEPPSIIATEQGENLHIEYNSHRPFADIAHGLIEGFITIYKENMSVERLSTSKDGTQAKFILRPI